MSNHDDYLDRNNPNEKPSAWVNCEDCGIDGFEDEFEVLCEVKFNKTYICENCAELRRIAEECEYA